MVEPEALTREQFISLLMVGDAGPNSLAPIIPIDHETYWSGWVTLLTWKAGYE
jgi:hypothetical protein